MGKRPKVVGGVVVPDPKKHRILAPTLTGDQFMTEFLLRMQSRDEFDFLCGEGRLFYGIAKDIIYSLEGPLNRVPSPEYVDALQKGTCDLYRDQVVTAKLVSEATMLYLVTGMRIYALSDGRGAAVEAEIHSKTDPKTRYLASFEWLGVEDTAGTLEYNIRHMRCECTFKKMNLTARFCTHVLAAFLTVAAAVREIPWTRPPNAVIRSLERETAVAQLGRKYVWPLVVRGWSTEFILDRKPPMQRHPLPTLRDFLEHSKDLAQTNAIPAQPGPTNKPSKSRSQPAAAAAPEMRRQLAAPRTGSRRIESSSASELPPRSISDVSAQVLPVPETASLEEQFLELQRRATLDPHSGRGMRSIRRPDRLN
jgi:hypothetical protein